MNKQECDYDEYPDLDESSKKFLRNLAAQTKYMNNISAADLDRYSERVVWRSFGPDGKGPSQNTLLKNLETSHIENIIVNLKHTSALTKRVFLHILKKRYQDECSRPVYRKSRKKER